MIAAPYRPAHPDELRREAAPLRLHLELACEAKRRGDHGAASVHELDVLRELRRQMAEAGR